MVSLARPAGEGSVNLKQHGAAPRRSRLGASWAQAWRRYPLHRSHWSVGTFLAGLSLGSLGEELKGAT